MLKQRRRDIQGLRALAILAVVLFHVWPQWFPSGYLGVQMFFVLSGYLMAMILSDGSSETILQTITGFYYRRMKRIVPVYLLVINCVLASSFYLFCCRSSSFHTRFIRDALPALAFGTNVENILESDDYFGQTDQYRFFTHCWSLGVEMQFYVLAPFILLTISRLDAGTSVLVCALLAALSLLLQLASESVIAFNLVFCRIWQFTAGIAAFQVSDRGDVVPAGYVPVPNNLDSEEVESEERAMPRTLYGIYYALLLGLCTCVFCGPVYLRGLEEYACITLTACLLAIGSRSDDSTVLTSIPMALIGDASYVLYLIHWPAIEWYKYQTGSVRFNALEGTSLIVGVLVASLLLHLAVEKPIVRTQSVPVVIGLVLTLYLAAITFAYLHGSVAQNNWFQSHSDPGVAEYPTRNGLDAIVKLYTEGGSDALANLTFSKDEQIAKNEHLEEYTHKWWENCPSAKELSNKYHLRRHITECKFEGRGNMTFLVMGNSHAKHNMLSIARAFEDDFSTMHVFERSACVPIEGLEDFAACRQFRRAMMDTVSRVRPDALFLIFKFMGSDLPELQEPLINDTTVARFQSELDELSQFAGTIFVGLPHLKFDYDVPMEISKRLEMNQSLDSINLKLGEHYAFHKNRFRMFGALKCTKCLWIDWTKAFCDRDSGVCDAYERNSLIGYFIDVTHYSVLGSMKALPLFEELRKNWTRSRLLAE